MIIKASRITNLTDARYFAAKEVDFLGFNLEADTAGYLDPIYMRAIREWVEGPVIVGEFSGTPEPVVREAARFYDLEAVQLTLTPDAPSPATLDDLTLILEINYWESPAALAERLVRQAPFTRYFLLNFSENPAAQATLRSEADFWKERFAQHPVLLHLDASPAETLDLLERLQPAGLSLSGGEEERVGVKSFDEVEEIFEGFGR